MRIFILFILFTGLTACKKELRQLPAEKLTLPVSASFRDVHVFNDNEMIICGGDDDFGVILKTTDGGASWQQSSSDLLHAVNSLFFINADTGFCADSDIHIYKTTDGGITWNAFYGTSWPLTVNRNLRDIWFNTDSTGFVCGGKNFGNGVLFKTSNSGSYWSFSEFAHEFRGICFADATNGVLCGYGSLQVTHDGGHTYTAVENSNAYYTGICMDPFGNFWICDFNGSVYTSNNNGDSWRTVRDASSWNVNGNQQNCIGISTSGRIACAGPNGFFTWSDDFGNSWNDRESFSGNDILKIEWIDDSHLIATGKNGGVYRVKI